jgi:rare lipoprotein A
MKAISLAGIFFFGLSIGCFGQNVDSGASAPTAAGPKNPVETGIASWYGPEFAGKPTASGELFDPKALTAAHPTLPFGTWVRITNKNNGKQVTVRINDRGPFVANRSIDLSQAAAERLDMGKTGIIPVTLEVLPPAGMVKPAETNTAAAVPPLGPPGADASTPLATLEPPGSSTVATSDPQRNSTVATPGTKGKSYRIQVGSFKLSRNAVDAINRIKAAGLEPAYERFQDLYRVVVVQVPQLNLEAVKAQLGSAGFTNLLIREEASLP